MKGNRNVNQQRMAEPTSESTIGLDLGDPLEPLLCDRFQRCHSEGGPDSHQPKLLQQVKGVGPLISLAYVLTLENPARFHKSRMVGSYLGLQPKQSQSGDRSPQLGITKSGNGFLRRMLVQAAQYILGPLASDCRLRRGAWICAAAVERTARNAR
jgi:transposase